MTTIYELSAEYTEKLDRLGDMLSNGEDVSIEQSMAILDLQDDIQAKVVNIAKYSKGVVADSAALAKEIAALTARKKAKDEHLSKLKESAMMAMQLVKIDRIDDVIMPVRLQENSKCSVTVENPESLPAYYQKVTITADKDKLLNHGGGNIKGVTITKGKHIRFGN